MKTDFPQDKIQIFLDILEPFIPVAMPALLHPTPSLPLLEQIGRLLESIGTSENTDTYNIIHAALLILADDLHTAHDIVQNIHTPHAAAFHAIIHRREADFWNSNYWWRRAQGIAWPTLPAELAPLLKPHQSTLGTLCTPSYSPSTFTDIVEQHHRNPTLAPTLIHIQRLEWKSLLLTTLRPL